MPTHATALSTTERPPAPPTAPAPAADQVLTAPADPRGAALVAFALQVRRAVQDGRRELLVDDSACSQWSPGHLLVLERLRDRVERCGARWTSAAGR